MSYHEAESAFRDFAAGCGYTLPDVLADGRIQRFHVDGDRRGSRNGYYSFHAFADGGAWGMVGSWKDREPHKWHWRGEGDGQQRSLRRLSPAAAALAKQQAQQREQARRQEQERREARRAEEHAEALRRMRLEWHRAPYADDRHPYCRAKGISARPYRSHALRLGSHGELLVPAYGFADESSWRLELRSLQRIYAPDASGNSSKRNAKGCPLSGAVFYPFGRPRPQEVPEAKQPLVLAEGWATAATVYQALGFDAAEPWQVLCCFGAGNLLAVAREAHARAPERPIVIAADDDAKGRDAALAAARGVGGGVALPQFPADCRRTAKDTDFNDLARLSPDGVEAVLQCLQRPTRADGGEW